MKDRNLSNLKCTNENCERTPYNQLPNGKCILHCSKDDWYDNYADIYKNEDNQEFWKEIRAIRQKQNFMMFEEIIFPSTTRFHRVLNGMYGSSEVLEKDFLFWKKGEKKEIDELLQFRNCTFYNFDFYAIDAGSVIFENIEVRGELGILFSDITLIILRDSQKINKLYIKNQKETELELFNSQFDECVFEDVSFKEIRISNSTFQEIAFNGVEILKGFFKESHFRYIKQFTNFCLLDKEKFQYELVDVEKSYSKEYFRFFKHLFNEKKDYIHESEMYADEMNTYLQETWINFTKGYNYNFKYFPNLIILGFGKISSNFTQCWILPLIWIIVLSLGFYCTSYDTIILDEFVQFLSPFNTQDSLGDVKNMSYSKWLLHKVLSSLFLYQLVITLKRKTKI